MARHTLSKSSFIRGVQCHKSLYLYKNRYFLRDKLSPEQLAKFRRGTDVGVLARQLFPGGVDASPASHFQYAKAAQQTAEMIAKKTPVIYEASFIHKGVLVALDILEFRDDKWYAYEVKSSLSISDTYLMDAALQYYVIRGCGLELEDIFIIHANKDYVLQSELDLNRLFVKQSVQQIARSHEPWIEQEIAAQLQVVKLKKSPAIDIGPHCNKPYPCDFQGHCWKHIPQNSIFELQWLSDEQKFDLYSKKILITQDIPELYLTDPVQKMKFEAHKNGTAYFDQEGTRNFFEGLKFPFCFLKAWYHRPAVPLFEGTKPYEKLPFVVSLGIRRQMQDPLEITHHFFDPKVNPLPEFRGLLAEELKECQTALVYDDLFPGQFLETFGLNYANSFFDLQDIFANHLYYEPKTKGDTQLQSIATIILKNKKVLKDVYNSGIEATIAYLSGKGSENEYSNFRRLMQRTSEQHLLWMEGVYVFLAGY
jgi:hypothetical protein